MKRRTFVRLGILGLIATIGGIYILNFKRTVRQMLASDTEDLGVDEKMIDTFMAEAAQEQYWRTFSTPKQMLICVVHFFQRFGIHLPYYAKYRQYRNMITGQFLFSTDFFINKMARNKPVQYMRFLNPYKAPCANPFSNLRFSA